MTAIVCQFLWSGIVSDEDRNRPEGPQYTLKVSWHYRTVSPQSVTTIKMKRCCSVRKKNIHGRSLEIPRGRGS